MSAAVDVLAVLDEAIPAWEIGCDHNRLSDMREARAAVAELIEKSAAALHYMRLHKYADQAWADDLAAAIARVRGGAE